MACILPTRRRRRGSATPGLRARGGGRSVVRVPRRVSPLRVSPCASGRRGLLGAGSAPRACRSGYARPAAMATRPAPPPGPARPASARSPFLPQCRPGGGRARGEAAGVPARARPRPLGRALWCLGPRGRSRGLRPSGTLAAFWGCPGPAARARLAPFGAGPYSERPLGRTEGSGPRATPSVVDTPTAPPWRPSMLAPSRAGLCRAAGVGPPPGVSEGLRTPRRDQRLQLLPHPAGQPSHRLGREVQGPDGPPRLPGSRAVVTNPLTAPLGSCMPQAGHRAGQRPLSFLGGWTPCPPPGGLGCPSS